MNVKNRRIFYIKGFFILFACLIIGRAVQIQIGKDPRLEKLANRQFKSKIVSMPRRGLIFDRNGEGLAISLKVRSLFFRPRLFRKELPRKKRFETYRRLSKILRVSQSKIRKKAASKRGFVWVKRHLSLKEEQAIKETGILGETEGLALVEETKRFYPHQKLAAHILGTVGVDGGGLEGLELFYNAILSGKKKRIASTRDARGKKIFKDGDGLLAFQDGQSLVLTLDKAIQYETEKALRGAIQKYRAKAGTAIVAQVETGEILALANYPTFNPNRAGKYPARFRRNRAITDTYEPGSTFKPFVIAKTLELGVSPKKKIYCEKGSYKVGKHTITEAEVTEKFEWLSFGEILQHSSNIGAAKIALDLGPKKMADLMHKLKIGQKTRIDLPGEVSGIFSSKRLKTPIHLANVGFGHGFTVTPLQMLSLYLSVANGGTWIQPKLVRTIVSEDPDSLEAGALKWKDGHRFDQLNSKQILEPGIASKLTEMLELVVQEGGTATRAQLDEWSVAGKTGTSQKVDRRTRRYSRKHYISSFVGFAPSRDPRIVALVVLDEPRKSYYAGETAAPTFKEIMKASLLRKRISPVNKAAKIQSLANQSLLSAIEKDSMRSLTGIEDLVFESQGETFLMPNLKGLTIREVIRKIGTKSVKLEIAGSGVLKRQWPPPNKWVKPKSKIILKFSHKQ